MAMTMVPESDLPPAYCTINESTLKLDDDEVPEVVVPTTDDDEETLCETSFEDRNTRIAFIQKVLSITLVELLAVLLVMFCFVTNYSFRYSFRYNFANYIVCASLGYMFVLGLLIHSTETRWKKPFNYMFLVVYPVSFGIFISIVGYDILEEGIIVAWAYFCAVIFTLLIYSVFALQSKLEFTVRIGFCIIFGLLIVLYVTVPAFYLRPFYVLYPTMVVLFLCSYILCDLDAMLEKHYRFALTPDDFVNGALIIHIDYLYIFTKWYKAIKSEYF